MGLLVIGLVFPVLSFLTALRAWYSWKRDGVHCSPIFLPFVGPICITAWLVRTGRPEWIIPIAWLGDLGTVAFLWVCPRLILEWWTTSRFTRLLELLGSSENQLARLSVHRNGRYSLRKTWRLRRGQTGILELEELGSYTLIGDSYRLTSDDGCSRELSPESGRRFRVQEDSTVARNHPDRSIAGWWFALRR